MEVVASLSQGRTAAAQCGFFTQKSVPVIFEPPCILELVHCSIKKTPAKYCDCFIAAVCALVFKCFSSSSLPCGIYLPHVIL